MKLYKPILFCLFFAGHLAAQPDSAKIFKRRQAILYSVTGATYVSSVVMLHAMWYKDYQTGSFHFFNDNHEWKQMDKWGHGFTTYQIGLAGVESMRWAGAKEQKAVWMGAFVGTAYMTTIEVLDGFSEGWGFSWGDMGANAGGSLLVALQEHYWKEQRISMKFSFRKSMYASYRPDLLGHNFGEQVLKDYNGQLYWMSVNIKSFLKKESSFPGWLNLAFGYGARGMTGGTQNPVYVDANGTTHDFVRQRRFLFSLDCDLTKIRTRSVFLKKVLRTLNCIKIPFPALELSGGKSKLNYLGY